MSSDPIEGHWYHTIELPDGVTTPGLFDHRPVLDRYALPESLAGQRVLDVGTFDGFFAFELERRGAEVVALDVPAAEDLDWPAPIRHQAADRQVTYDRFEHAHAALGSNVVRERLRVYDATPARLGTFDLVFVGSVIPHVRDPAGMLMALRTVCTGTLHLAETIDAVLDRVARRQPLARLTTPDGRLEWWTPNRAALRGLAEAAGFVDVQVGPRFTVPFRGRRGGIPHAVLTARPGPFPTS